MLTPRPTCQRTGCTHLAAATFTSTTGRTGHLCTEHAANVRRNITELARCVWTETTTYDEAPAPLAVTVHTRPAGRADYYRPAEHIAGHLVDLSPLLVIIRTGAAGEIPRTRCIARHRLAGITLHTPAAA